MNTELKISLKKIDSNALFVIDGEIDSTNYEIFRKALFSEFKLTEDISKIIFELKNCGLISSNGFGIFYEFRDTIEKRGFNGGIKIINANKAVIKLIKMLKMDDEFIVET